jgi:MFS transporter, OFA family, oxalate/formate antiporter
MDDVRAGKGWLVVAAGTGLNLALGVLYTWSIFAKQMTEPLAGGGFGWSKTASALPYTLAIAVFALMMIPAGRLQDRLGPRLVATCGAILIGLGLIVAGFATADSMAPALLGFGVLGGAGIGLGYAAATPAAVKWFPPERKGMITGIVVSGFGVAPVYIAPLSRYLLDTYGLSGAFRILGVSFAVLAGLLCQFIVNPPAKSPTAVANAAATGDSWRDMLRTRTFYVLWLQYACAATAGLMIIGHLAKIITIQSGGGITLGYLFVALLAIFNASGRIAAGFFSDRIGRNKTLAMVCLCQAVAMFFFSSLSGSAGFFTGAALVGFNYGACLSLFPSKTADAWGTRNFGLNYGILFTAWGVGGVFGPILAGRIADSTGSYSLAFAIASGMMLFAAALSLVQGRFGVARQAA